MDDIRVVEIDYDHSHRVRSYRKGDGSASHDDGDIAISPAAVFPMGGNTYIPSYDALCNMDAPPPLMGENKMGVITFRGDALPIEHPDVFTDNLTANERASRIAIAHARNARQEVGQEQLEQTARARQMSDTFLLLVKVTAASFVLSLIAIAFLMWQTGNGAPPA